MDTTGFLANLSIFRTSLTKLMGRTDSKIDLNKECGYPDKLTAELFKNYYDREGIARRVVDLYPDECWNESPTIVETPDEGKTDFEQALHDYSKKYNLWETLHRLDRVSGIGEYGILIMGWADGKKLDEPLAGINEDGSIDATPPVYELLYTQPIDQSQINIAQYNKDTQSPRYMYPEYYNVKYSDESVEQVKQVPAKEFKVHWSRVLHVADNKTVSNILGNSRMRPCFNRLFDLRKILSGSGEMFWKGAFPGLSIEMLPKLAEGNVDVDKEALAEELTEYDTGLKRWLGLVGMSAKSLAPQVADPSKHIAAQLQAISLNIGIPMRILIGAEEAKLASSQDIRSWNKRVRARQTHYVGPYLIRPAIHVLQAVGGLPLVDSYDIRWEDLNTPTDLDKSEVGERRARALQTYLAAEAWKIIHPIDFICDLYRCDPDEAKKKFEKAQQEADSHNMPESQSPEQNVVQPRKAQTEQDKKPSKAA